MLHRQWRPLWLLLLLRTYIHVRDTKDVSHDLVCTWVLQQTAVRCALDAFSFPFWACCSRTSIPVLSSLKAFLRAIEQSRRPVSSALLQQQRQWIVVMITDQIKMGTAGHGEKRRSGSCDHARGRWKHEKGCCAPGLTSQEDCCKRQTRGCAISFQSEQLLLLIFLLSGGGSQGSSMYAMYLMARVSQIPNDKWDAHGQQPQGSVSDQRCWTCPSPARCVLFYSLNSLTSDPQWT